MRTAARPAGLRAFRDELVHRDAALVDRAAQLRASLYDYARANPDFGADHRFLADELHDLARQLVRLDVHVGAVASAFEDADATVTLLGVTYATERALTTAMATAEARPVDLRELLVPLTERSWYELVWGVFVCPTGVLGTYRGGGAVVGPDGRLYPLVVPELEVDGRIAHATRVPDVALDPGTLGGSDGGWTTLATRRGVARIADLPGWWEKAAVFAGMASGLDATVTSFASPEELADLDVSPSGWPSLGRRPSPAGSLPPVPAAIEVDNADPTAATAGHRGPGPPGAPGGGGSDRDRHTRRSAHSSGQRRPDVGTARPIVPPRSPASGAAGALELVGGIARGADAVQAVDRAGWAAYQLVYETHADGRRRRAQLRLFQVVKGPHGSPATITPELGYLDGEVFTTTPLRYHGSQQPTIGPADTASNGVVHELPSHRHDRRR